MRKVVLVRYGEVALKSSSVRARFERLLLSNVRKVVGELGRVYRIPARIVVETGRPQAVSRIVSRIPGVVSCSPSVRVPSDLQEIALAAVRLAKKSISRGQSFAVRTSREGVHPFTSTEVNRVVGERILRSVEGCRVDLSNPDREIFIEIRGRDAFIFTRKIGGVGGLPVGSEGKVVCIFDGRLRDARAAFLMMKRGCTVEFLSSTKDLGLIKELLVHHPCYHVFICTTTLSSIERASNRVKKFLHRMLMLRVGREFAKRRGAPCLVTSDGLPEVARFGLRGIGLMDRASDVPVLRPLVGEDLATGRRPGRPGAAVLPSDRQLEEFEKEVSAKLDEILDSLEVLEVGR